MLKIVTIVGARPQFVKVAAVSRAIVRHNTTCLFSDQISEIIVHTGQHYDENMSQIFFDELQIPAPDHCLEVGSGKHGEQTGLMLQRIEDVLLTIKPDFVMIYGDTNSTLAGALAAVKQHIPIAHVEAGLRSYNRHMPEEINRIVADQISNILFCPTVVGLDNLRKEGIGNPRIKGQPFDINTQSVHLVGDVMFDSVLFNGQIAEEKSSILKTLELTGSFVLATLHRAENTDNSERLAEILKAFYLISKESTIVLPLHPRTRKCVASSGLEFSGSGLKIIEPVGYLDMLLLEKNAAVIITDSGGVQKEAYFMKVPCVTLRDETEWTETVHLGWNNLVGADSEKILNAFELAISAEKGNAPFQIAGDGPAAPYGDGKAAEKIVSTLVDFSRKAVELERQVV